MEDIELDEVIILVRAGSLPLEPEHGELDEAFVLDLKRRLEGTGLEIVGITRGEESVGTIGEGGE